jgi:hypothetical protein
MAEKAAVYVKTSEPKQQSSSLCKQESCVNNSGSPANRILHLQHTAGNQAVQKLIRSGFLQAKIKIGQPNDMYEQEADSLTAVDGVTSRENAAETVLGEGYFKSPAISQKDLPGRKKMLRTRQLLINYK